MTGTKELTGAMVGQLRQAVRLLIALTVVLALSAAVPPDGYTHAGSRGAARVVAEHESGPRITDLTVRSPALGRDARVRLLTPDGWEKRGPGDRWPVLYLFAGGDGDHETWTREYEVQKKPELHDVLVVMPEMPLFGFYSDWWNGGRGGPPGVESFHLREMLPLLERDYGAGTRRAAAGESQGGFGAISYAARHPGLFQSVASYSGYVHPLQHPHTVRAAMTYLGLDWRALWGDPVAQRANWQAHDPYYLAERLRGTRVHLSSGDGRLGALDPPGTERDPHIPGVEDPADPFPDDVYSPTEAIMNEESRTLAARLKRAGAEVTTHFYTGTHSPAYWHRELDRTLPTLLDSLGGGARVVAEERVGPRLVDLTLDSPALGRRAKVRLLTPNGWAERGPGDRWPVLYLLHGGFEPETYRTWTRESDVEEIPELRDVLVVMPEGGTVGFYSDWWNEGKDGPPAWETFHLDEVRPLLEQGYGAGERRAVAGLSMGGFGAVSYAARRPGMFAAAASYSGPVHLLHPRMRETWPQLEEAYGGKGSLRGLWGDPVAQRAVWQAHDPYHLAGRLRGTEVFLSVGDGNPGPLDPPGSAYDPAEPGLDAMNRSLAARLARLGIPAATHFHTGTHHPAYGARELHHSLPMLMETLTE
ncbi:alpha/beta hydrolase [Streptomyces sp. NPDC020898]|uniref:alpha/beta hydrolase n=1 Tax=Streptomyces sp. NPDC020898 TaxID=3365101 RepID=UPI0037B47F80